VITAAKARKQESKKEWNGKQRGQAIGVDGEDDGDGDVPLLHACSGLKQQQLGSSNARLWHSETFCSETQRQRYESVGYNHHCACFGFLFLLWFCFGFVVVLANAKSKHSPL